MFKTSLAFCIPILLTYALFGSGQRVTGASSEAASVGATAPSGITAAEIPLSWTFSTHCASGNVGAFGNGYYATAPSTHGFFFRRIELLNGNTSNDVLVYIDGQPRYRTKWGSVIENLLLRPGESIAIASLNNGAFYGANLRVAVIPASELPPIPPM